MKLSWPFIVECDLFDSAVFDKEREKLSGTFERVDLALLATERILLLSESLGAEAGVDCELGVERPLPTVREDSLEGRGGGEDRDEASDTRDELGGKAGERSSGVDDMALMSPERGVAPI